MKCLHILLTTILLSVCVTSQARPVISITGSSTILPLMRELATRFENTTGIGVSVSGGGSSKGLSDVISGQTDIGMVSRKLNTQEARLVKPYLIAYDGVTVIVHASNDIKQLSEQQLVRIFGGQIHSWSELGGKNIPIDINMKAKNRATRNVFDKFFNITDVSSQAEVVGSNAEMVVLVGTSPGAIGYVSIGAVEKALEYGVLIKALPLRNIQPTHKHVRDHSYKMTRMLNIVTRQKTNVSINKFIDFVLSKHAEEVISKYNFIAVN